MNAIVARNLGKKFKLFKSQRGRLIEYLSVGRISQHLDFWALKDVSFEISAGTTLGILGQNGSGKSTLLSILAGVLYPSEGSFEINGKVSAILELGSGFHLDFSGRDNIYMYGSIMGLSKQEIDERYNEIIQFSELGDFIDQPLRMYSSGMIVRLAFSVAVNVNADILIVDEALAVGDAIFQHRCFRKIREMQESGKTILYVGHDTEAVRNLCTHALLLDGGHIVERGDPNLVVNKYHALIVDREKTYSDGNLIEHGELPREGYETLYDFTQCLGEANIVCSESDPVREMAIDVHFSPRKVIFAHPPSRISYSVVINSHSSLAFGIGILPDFWDKIPQGVKFDIDITLDGTTEKIFSRILQPKRNLGDRGWHNFIIPLEDYSGKTVIIRFSTSGSSGDLRYCWAAWGWVRLIAQPMVDSALFLRQDLKTTTGTFEEMIESSPSKMRIGNKSVEITQVKLYDENYNPKFTFQNGENAILLFYIKFNKTIRQPVTAGCTIRNKYSNIYAINTRWVGNDITDKSAGDILVVKITIPLLLGNGIYSITPAVAVVHTQGDSFSQPNIEILDSLEDSVFLKVNHSQMIGIVDLGAKVEVLDGLEEGKELTAELKVAEGEFDA